jgi:putative nucleotidyltransferase with HDIG domain
MWDSSGDPEVQAAQELAGRLLSGNPERLAHSAAVADRAEYLSAAVAPDRRSELVAAAWLHDIGYSEAVQQTTFHPVDGARYLRLNGWRIEVCNAVAHHSGSRFVAVVRRLESDLMDFAFTEDEVTDTLTVADQTVGPGGVPMIITVRMADMLRRHGPDSPNALAHARRGPYLLAAADRVAARLSRRGIPAEQHRISG